MCGSMSELPVFPDTDQLEMRRSLEAKQYKSARQPATRAIEKIYTATL